MDPNTSTRQRFTDAILAQACPDNAAPAWRGLFTKLQALLRALAEHPAMQPNMQQAFMTPAASKNSVYFCWDFVGRTLVGGHSTPAFNCLCRSLNASLMLAGSIHLECRPYFDKLRRQDKGALGRR